MSESKTGRRKPTAEHISLVSPIIIDAQIFAQVQKQLKERNPRVTPPWVVSGPILLTGLATCATCAGAMTLRTGTSKTGKVHKYYSCSTSARKGKSVCKGRSINLEKLDKLVTTQLIERLFDPERLKAHLGALAARRAEKSAAVEIRIQQLAASAADADERLRRLYKMVENGLADMDDILKDRITALKAERERAQSALTLAQGTNQVAIAVDDRKIAAFSKSMREQLHRKRSPDPLLS